MKPLFKLVAGAGALAIVSGCASLSSSSSSSTPASQSGWTVLFEGTSTANLRGYKMTSFPNRGWIIENGSLKTVPPGSDGGQVVDLVTREKYKDFELELEWKVAPGGNSGVMYHVAETDGSPYATGPEMQILDDDKHPDGKNPKTSAGALYALVAPNASKHLNPVGQWNKAKIIFKNNHVQHWLNGAKVVEYQWDSPEIRALVGKSKFADMPRFMKEQEGYIDFQHHGQEFWLRNVRVRRI